MNELRIYAEYLRKRADRVEEFADLWEKYPNPDIRSQIISWVNNTELSAKDAQEILDSES